MGGVFDVVTGLGNAFGAALRGDWAGAFDGLAQAADGAWTVIQEILSGIGGLVANLWDWTINVGVPAVTGWLADNAGDIGQAILDAAGWAWDNIIVPLGQIILEIGGWVLERACEQLAHWHRTARLRHLTQRARRADPGRRDGPDAGRARGCGPVAEEDGEHRAGALDAVGYAGRSKGLGGGLPLLRLPQGRRLRPAPPLAGRPVRRRHRLRRLHQADERRRGVAVDPGQLAEGIEKEDVECGVCFSPPARAG